VLLVETVVRPSRIAWVLPEQPSTRAANRTFRLATSRWGGRYDVIVQRAADEPMSDFAASALKLADPDLILSVDKTLGGLDWSDDLARLRIQPFDTAHLPEGAGAHDWRPWLAGQPTVAEDDAARRVQAASGTTFDWKLAARYGLVRPGSESLKAVADDDVPTALEATSEGLTQRAALGRFLLVGLPGVPSAGRYWTLRALGARVIWLPEQLIDPGRELDSRWRRAFSISRVMAPDLPAAELRQRLKDLKVRRPRIAPEDLRTIDDRAPQAPEYARQAIVVSPHRDGLRFTLPVPDTGGRPLSTVVAVAEHRLRTLDPQSPDGVVLSPDLVSRELLARGRSFNDVRVGADSIAVQQRLGDSSLQEVPLVGFRDAVSAPLRAAGYEVFLSDKGRFQTKMLEQARGLRFLAWVLCQKDSRHLLGLFDEHHVEGETIRGDSYRRSATFAEFRERTHERLRETGRLTAGRRESSDRWLRDWADQLLDRGMLVGGFHLKCPDCLLGAFYAAERTDARFCCDRCSAVSVVPGDAERRLRLGELFHMLRAQHGDVVTLVLSWLRGQARESLLYLPEVNLFLDGRLAGEADFIALVDGRLVLGEAKSNREIPRKELGKLVKIAEAAGAVQVVVATLDCDPACGTPSCEGCSEDGQPHPDHAWKPATRERVRASRAAIATRGIQLTSLDRAALLDAPAASLGELADPDPAFGTLSH
jgi:hypothetical protein